jgi:hypothetical protein
MSEIQHIIDEKDAEIIALQAKLAEVKRERDECREMKRKQINHDSEAIVLLQQRITALEEALKEVKEELKWRTKQSREPWSIRNYPMR